MDTHAAVNMLTNVPTTNNIEGGIAMNTKSTITINRITRLNLDGTSTQVAIFTNELARKLESMGCTDALIKLKSLIDDKLPEEEQCILQQTLQELVANGIDLNGKHYVPFCIGSSDSRKAISAWVDEEVYAGIGKWCMCGLTTKTLHIAINKYLAYIALLLSSTRSFESIFGRKLDPRRVCIVSDYDVVVHGVVDQVNGDQVIYDMEKDVKINAFDGCGLIMPNITNFTACTLRAPWMKCLVIPGNFRKFCKEHGSHTIKDIWGTEHNVDDLDAVLTASCFKMSKQYESWAQYCDAFEELGHTICVCVEEHAPHLKWMPYQQLQTLAGNDDDVKIFAGMAYKTFYAYRQPIGAAKLLGGNMGKAAALYPSLFAEPYMIQRVQEAYDSRRKCVLGGKVPDLGYNAFLAPDPLALLQHIAGLPVTGSLKAGECYCSNCEEGDVDITRNPHFDHAHVILHNVRKPNKHFFGPTMYINIFDLTTIRLRADYDGDHVWYSQNEHLLDLVRRTDAAYGNRPIDWEAPESVKGAINRSTVAGAFKRCTQMAQIGLYADALTKMFAHGYDRYVCAWLTYAGNVLIDAAKHGTANVKVPDAVKEVMYQKLPEFSRYAKADTERPLDDAEFWGKRCEMTDSFADNYSEACDKALPKDLVIEGSDNFVFNVSEMMINPRVAIDWSFGLCNKGTFNNIKGVYVNQGLFQEIAFRHAREWSDLRKDDDVQMKKQSWEELRGKAGFDEIKAYVESLGHTIEDAYDVITRWVFTKAKASEGYLHTVKDAYWRIFGHMTVQMLKDKRNAANISDDDLHLDDVDWLEDINEEPVEE